MDVAFIENTKNEIDHDKRRDDQHRHGRQGILERLRIALERRRDGRGQLYFGFGSGYGLRSLSEGNAGGEIEAERDRRELALMADR